MPSLNPNHSPGGTEGPVLQSVAGSAPPPKPSILARVLNAGFERKSRLIIEFSRNVATMLEAGLPLEKVLTRQLRHAKQDELRTIIEQLQGDIVAGRSFAQAITAQQDYFGQQYASVVTAGELSGKLVFALNKMADFLERGLQLRNKLYSLMMEPTFTLLIMLLNAALMLGVVLPAVVDSASQAMGKPVAWLMMVSWFSHFGWLVIGALAVMALVGLRQLLRTEFGKALVDEITLVVPVLGHLIRHMNATYFIMSLRMGYTAGLALPVAGEMAVESMTSQFLKEDAMQVNERLATDASLTTALEGMAWVPGEVLDMIEVGEESGTLEQTFDMALAFLDREIDAKIDLLKAMIRPLMVLMSFVLFGLVFALFIGTVVLSLTQSLDEAMRSALGPTGKP